MESSNLLSDAEYVADFTKYLPFVWGFLGLFFLLVIIAIIIIYKKEKRLELDLLVPIYGQWILLRLVEIHGWLILLPGINIIALIICLFKLTKKEEQKEEYISPDLMAPDPIKNDKVDLMAADPIASYISDEVKPEKKPEIEEQPGIETQMIEKEPPEVITNNLPDNNTISPVVNAFDMKMPVLNNEEKIETLDLEHHITSKTQKFCPSCGTPNDVLNKFCVSCGHNF